MHAAQPKASICIPTYNQADFLRACLRSALTQTCDDYEVVLSVNHCTDHTEAVVAEFAGDPRLRVIRPERFLSAGENFRFVLAAARGTFINFLSSDDQLYPDFLAAQLPTLERNERLAFSFTAGELVDQHGALLQINRPLGGSYVRSGRSELPRYIHRLRATGTALLIRRAMYEAIGGLTTQIVDWEVCIKLLCAGDVAYCDRVLSRVTIWSNAERLARRVELIREIGEFFDDAERFVVRTHPELRGTFKRARAAMALRETLTLKQYGELEPRARQYLLQLSNAPMVQALRLGIDHLGFEPALKGVLRSNEWIRLQAKRILRTIDEHRASMPRP
jgi:glycosyltransferase involved in cell wall biosynthesis